MVSRARARGGPAAQPARGADRGRARPGDRPRDGRRRGRATRPGIERVAAERVFGELKRVVSADAVRRGLALMDAYGLTAVVLPELSALRGIEQSHFHHADVHDHTLEVLDAVALLQRDPVAAGLDERGRRAARRAALGRAHPRPGDALRRAPARRRQAAYARRAPRRPGDVHRPRRRGRASSPATCSAGCAPRTRLRDYVAAIIAHHLDAGFLVHRRPLDRRTIWRYLRATQPFSADITIFTVADRLSTRGRNAERGDRRPPRGRARAARRGARGGRRRAAAAAGARRRADATPACPPARGSARSSPSSRRTATRASITTREEALARARELTG